MRGVLYLPDLEGLVVPAAQGVQEVLRAPQRYFLEYRGSLGCPAGPVALGDLGDQGVQAFSSLKKKGYILNNMILKYVLIQRDARTIKTESKTIKNITEQPAHFKYIHIPNAPFCLAETTNIPVFIWLLCDKPQHFLNLEVEKRGSIVFKTKYIYLSN